MAFAVPNNITLSRNYVAYYSIQVSISLAFLSDFCNMDDDIPQTITIVSNNFERDNEPPIDSTAIGFITLSDYVRPRSFNSIDNTWNITRCKSLSCMTHLV